jgi:hypothetical protein
VKKTKAAARHIAGTSQVYFNNLIQMKANYIARWTLPERKHLVQTLIRVGVPLTMA